MKKDNQFGSVSELMEGNFQDPNKVFHFRWISVNQDTSYASDPQGVHRIKAINPSIPFKMEEKIFHKETQKTRYIRHVVGEHSIFIDVQEKHGKPDKGNELPVTNLMFVDGNRQIVGNDNLILEYMKLSNYNRSNPDRDPTVLPLFYLYDRTKAVSGLIKNDKKVAEAMGWIYNPVNFDTVMAYGSTTLPGFDNLQAEEVQLRLSRMAHKDVTKFLDGINNPLIIKKYLIKEIALKGGFVVYDEAKNALYRQSGTHLLTSATGIDPINDFVDRTVSDVTGKWEQEYQDILVLIGRAKRKETATSPPKNDKHEEDLPIITGLTEQGAIELIEAGLKAKVFTQLMRNGRGKEPVKGGMSYKEDSKTERIYFAGRKTLIERLQSDIKFLTKVKSEIFVEA